MLRNCFVNNHITVFAVQVIKKMIILYIMKLHTMITKFYMLITATIYIHINDITINL